MTKGEVILFSLTTSNEGFSFLSKLPKYLFIKLITEEAIALIVNGYCKDVLNQLPMEFAVEAQKLLEISLEGSVG